MPIEKIATKTATNTPKKLAEKPIVTSRHPYQVGGSLPCNSPVYIHRQADVDLYQALQQQQFATVIGPRRMGKSSLRVRTRQRLESAGNRCATIYGTQLLDSPQDYYRWEKQLAALLWDSLCPGEPHIISQWIKDTEGLLPQQRLEHFTRELLRPLLREQPVVIFIDAAEALLKVPFLADDIFEWIWHCRCLRKIYPVYKRLNFVVLGSAIATDLIKNETLLSTGSAITLSSLDITDTAPLQKGFENQIANPALLLEAIFRWTAGQPLLTQKLCYLVKNQLNEFQPASQPASQPAALSSEDVAQWIDHLVRSAVVPTWNRQDDLAHLWEMFYQLTHSSHKKPLLALYQRILSGHPVQLNGDRIQSELILSGLVTARQGHLHSSNEIYRAIFGALQQ